MAKVDLMRRLFLTFFLALCLVSLIAQRQSDVSSTFIQQVQPSLYTTGGTDYICSTPLSGGVNYRVSLQPESPFSCFGIGFRTPYPVETVGDFRVRWRTEKDGAVSDWQHATTKYAPDEVAGEMYRTNALFTWDATSHEVIELDLFFPVGVQYIEVNLFNNEGDRSPASSPTPRSDSCLDFPVMIPREDWCGGSASCTSVLTTYSVSNISPTHTLIHHGASPQTYTDGAAIVQSYWNYHVNTLGWADIGYNYLLDKYGNLYQGRYNPQLPEVDVRAAHAGASNDESIGICFLGNLDVELATAPQLDKLYELLGWWYDFKSFDPLSSDDIQTQAFGVQVLPRISGHRDVNTTACPSDNLYAQLPAIRQSVVDFIAAAAAGCTDPTACNYDAAAQCDDGSCIFAPSGFDCNCDNAISLTASLSGGAASSLIQNGTGSLVSADITLNWTNEGGDGSWPADAVFAITDPNGNCTEWGGFNLSLGCNSIGNYAVLPAAWQSNDNGTYTATVNLAAEGLTGNGDWTLDLLNGWDASAGAGYDLSIALNGVCLFTEIPGCTDNMACNYDPEATTDDGSCTFPAEPYLDCEGNCLYDSDGDGICDENENCEDVCGPNTVWDEALGQCIGVEPAIYCGEGTTFDTDLQQCVTLPTTCIADVNADGTVNAADILVVLSQFGEACE